MRVVCEDQLSYEKDEEDNRVLCVRHVQCSFHTAFFGITNVGSVQI